MCSTGEGDKCEKNGVGYIIVCLTCQMDGLSTIYEGETARNAFTRGMEHQDALRLEDEENALWKQCIRMVQHSGIKAEFCMTVVGVHRTPLFFPLSNVIFALLHAYQEKY